MEEGHLLKLTMRIWIEVPIPDFREWGEFIRTFEVALTNKIVYRVVWCFGEVRNLKFTDSSGIKQC